jgi:hypothetical protein
LKIGAFAATRFSTSTRNEEFLDIVKVKKEKGKTEAISRGGLWSCEMV